MIFTLNDIDIHVKGCTLTTRTNKFIFLEWSDILLTGKCDSRSHYYHPQMKFGVR